MTDRYHMIRRNRQLVWIGIGLGYGLALVVFLLGLDWSTIPSTLALSVAAAVPPTLALISLDRRPGLLPAGSIGALVFGLIYLTLLFPLVLVALIWGIAFLWRPLPVEVTRGQWWARAGLGLAVAAAVFVMTFHQDPTCESSVSGTSSSSSCSSDTVVWWEAGASLLISGAVVGLGMRWPVNRQLTAEGPVAPVDSTP